MTEHDEALRASAEAAEPTQIAVARLVRRAKRTLDTRGHAPGVGRGTYRFAFVSVLGLAGLLVAGALLYRRESPPPQTVALAADTPTHLPVGGDVALLYAGRGALDGGAARPRITWEAGELTVEVVPERGVDLVVETPEGTASVVGTAFTVTRDALGTRIAVRRGTVAVQCRDGREARLGAERSLVCLPVRAAGMLARARALEAASAEAADVLEALDAGLRLDPEGGPVRAELAARRIRVLEALRRDDDAAAAADAWLASGETLRRDEVRALAIGLALRRRDCETATAVSASAPPPLDAGAAIALADCTQDPARARALLHSARLAEPARAAEVDARLARLPTIP
jgi:hypothetical protein